MEPISGMKTIGYIFCLFLSSIIMTIKTCYTPISNDKELVEVSPDDSIKIIKKEIDSVIRVVEIKVNANEIELKKVDTALAKQLRREPILKPAPIQKPKEKKKPGAWLYDIFK